MLTGQKIGLRAIEISDLPQMQAWRNNASMRKYYREYRELNMYDQQQWFNNICCGNPNFCMFGIVCIKSCAINGVAVKQDDLIGVCGLTNIHWVLRSAEISFYIGIGDVYVDSIYAPESVLLLCDYAFSTLNMHKIWAEIYEFDTQKTKLFESMNWHKDGILRDNAYHNNSYFNSCIYSTLISEYSHLQSNRPNGDLVNV